MSEQKTTCSCSLRSICSNMFTVFPERKMEENYLAQMYAKSHCYPKDYLVWKRLNKFTLTGFHNKSLSNPWFQRYHYENGNASSCCLRCDLVRSGCCVLLTS